MFKLNSKGFGKYEVLTVMVLIIVVMAILLYSLLGGANKKQFDNMRSDAVQLNKAVYTNLDSYHNQNVVYLDEVIDQQIIDKLKSPFSSNKCDGIQSKVVTEGDTNRFVTLKCDQYLIDNENVGDDKNVNIYEVSEWSTKKITGDDVEEKELYNCKDNGKELLEEYVEEDYLVYATNKLYSLNNYYLNDDICNIVKKTFYRTKKLVEEK